MATHNLSIEDFLITEQRAAAEIPREQKYRSFLPLFYAVIGVALGALTGITIATVSPAAGNSWLPIVSAASHLCDSASQTVREAAAVPAQQLANLAAMVHPARTGSIAVSTQHLAASRVVAENPNSNRQALVERLAALHPAISTSHAEARNWSTRIAFAKIRRFRLSGSYRARPARVVTASTANTAAPLMMAAVEQLGSRNQAAPTAAYIEGNFTVASYDASSGTIETNDGRTFAVGMTVVAGNASTWDDSGSNVHYRCSQTGSCTLSGSGIFASNARLI